MLKAIGVDIGGTKIAVASINQVGQLTQRIELPSQTQSKEAMYQQVTQAITLFLEKSQTTLADYQGIGVGVPGKVDLVAGIAVYQNNLPWENFPLVARLKATYPQTLIKLDNDVYQAAYAEWRAAQINQEDVFVYYTISTGIACAIIKGGQFIRGSGFAGESGLCPVINLGGQGKVGRLEALAAGPAIERQAQVSYGLPALTTQDVFERYQAQEPEAVEIVANMVESLTHSVYTIICLIDPKKIVFGGSISLHQPFIIDKIRERLADYIIAPQKASLGSLSVSQLANNAGIIGAALRVFN